MASASAFQAEDDSSILFICSNLCFNVYGLEIVGIYERIIHLVIGNTLKSVSSIYSFLARISYNTNTLSFRWLSKAADFHALRVDNNRWGKIWKHH